MKILSYSIYLVVIILFSHCSSEKHKEDRIKANPDELNSSISSYMSDSLGFDSLKVESIIENSSISINLKFNEKYYADGESNKIIVALLIYKYYRFLNEYKSVAFVLYRNRFSQTPLLYIYTKELLDTSFNNSSKNPLFIDFIEYSIRNIPPDEIVTCNAIVEINNKISKTSDFTGSFWLLLYRYSEVSDTNNIIFEYFDTFYFWTNFEKFKMDQKKYKYFIDKKRGNSK